MIVLIDVSLSHTFLSSSSTFFLFRDLGVNFLAHAHPLHECSKYRKGVDQFDLYLTSGLGTSPDKNPKETKCETFVLNNLFSLSSQSLACTQTPSGDIRVTDSKSSCTFCSFVIILRQRRWIELIKYYDVGISYTPGKANVMADALSPKSYCKNL